MNALLATLHTYADAASNDCPFRQFSALCGEAAGEIERLQEENARIKVENRVLREPALHINLTQLCLDSHAMAKEKGWYEKPRDVPGLIALMHSELSEALECFRDGVMDDDLAANGKPEGFGVELADAVIRIADACGYLGVDLEQCVKVKMKYNGTRPQRHGGKAA